MKFKSYTRGLVVASGLILAPCVTQAQNLADGLLNYWNFEDNAEDTASDFAGSTGTTDDDGSVDGTTVTFVEGQAGFGQAANFPGGAGNNIVILDPDADTNDIDRSGANVSISLWAQLTNRDTAWQALIAHGEGSDYRIGIRNSNNPVQVNYAGGGGDILTDNTIGPGPGGDGLWHHIVAVTDGTVSRLYLDGVLEDTGTVTAIAENGQNQLIIGGNPDVERNWNGLIDDMAMWDRALTQAEVSLIFNTGATVGADLSTILITTDSDGDGLTDAWENQFGLDPTDDGITGPNADPNNGAAGDPDNDSSSNLDEQANGTSPVDDDSDDDAILDGFETNRDPATFISSTDTGTDPLNPDTDGDGIDDGAEAFDPVAMTGSDPTSADTDGDTLPDLYEVSNGLDPQIDDTVLDADGDTLTNLAEFTIGTDPQSADSDLDSVDDGVEVTNGTDPLNPDSDFDTLLDGSEIANGTNPLLRDSDGDGFDDNAEIALGTSPTDPNDTPAASTLPIIDDLEDGVISFTDWRTISGGVSQNREGDVLGGSVTEADGSLNLESRGYLITNSQFDPELTGGVEITGEFTFLDGDDVFSIITRGDAEPVTVFGEVNSGIRFSISNRNSELTLDARGNDLTIENVVETGAIEFAANVPYTFTVIDDGQGNLSMVVSEIGNLENTVSITGDLTADTSDTNFIAFYNREFGRMTSIQNLSIISAVSNDSIEITDFSFDSEVGANGTFSVTWTSSLDVSYAIFFSTDLQDWNSDVTDGIIGQDGTTTETFGHPSPEEPRLFFRVELSRE